MTADVHIFLQNYRTGVMCRLSGVEFPQLYRVTGYEGVPAPYKNSYKLEPGELAPVKYKLAEFRGSPYDLLNATFTTIRTLDTEIDDGWIMLRHHTSEVHMEGYLDCLLDCHTGDFDRAENFYKNPTGILSLKHRTASHGCPNHLVIYVAKQMGDREVTEDQYTIILPDGSVKEDTTDLLHSLKDDWHA